MRLFRFANAPMNMFNDHTQKEMEKAVYQWFKGNDDSEYQRMRTERDRQANERAWKRWNALDMQKKAEWDVKDMAKRGKDIGAAKKVMAFISKMLFQQVILRYVEKFDILTIMKFLNGKAVQIRIQGLQIEVISIVC